MKTTPSQKTHSTQRTLKTLVKLAAALIFENEKLRAELELRSVKPRRPRAA